MAVWPRTRGKVRPCPFCESTLGIGATSCRRCGLPLVDLNSSSLPGADERDAYRRPLRPREPMVRLTRERKAIAILVVVILISLLGLVLTAERRGSDYSGQDLSGMTLSAGGVNLVGANFSQANLAYADLSGQDLFAADFASANLGSANFRGSQASEASLRDANLAYARLAAAQLTGADFAGADLTGADFTGADIAEANIASAYRCRTIMPDEFVDNTKTKECLATSGKILPDGTIDDAGGPGDHDGRGCHSLGGDGGAAPQVLAAGPDGETLVQGKNCQCNVKLNGNDWNDWIDHWLKYAYPPDDSQSGDYSDQFTYFKGSKPDVTFDEQGGRNAKAQGTNVDWSACWTTTIDDMVALQNALWQRRGEWWNGQIPLQPEGHRNLTDVEGQPYYWGWNEVPFFNEVDFVENRDATNIMLPANFDSLDSLDDTAKKFLLSGIKTMVNDSDAKRALDISAEPDVVIMAQESVGGKSWKREFYCQDYTFDPNKPDLLQIKYDSSGDGRCYLTGTLRPDAS
jgi:uncharacterized protein YjbI with pentapeptide repeats